MALPALRLVVCIFGLLWGTVMYSTHLVPLMPCPQCVTQLVNASPVLV